MNPNDRHIFGWDYPPGAEHDPRAPWNQVDDWGMCILCDQDLTEDEAASDVEICAECRAEITDEIDGEVTSKGGEG